MDLGITGRIALVTGASRGIGKGAAFALAREGADVVISARGENDLKKTADEIAGAAGVRVRALPCDMSSPANIPGLVERATGELGPIDICVANSGGPKAGSVLDMDEDAWNHAVNNNFLSMVRLCLAVVGPMTKRGWGRIITITSDSVREVADGIALSSIVRPGVASFVKLLARQVAKAGVTVNNLMPGGFRTSRAEELASRQADETGKSVDQIISESAAETPMGRIGDPVEIGNVVAFLAGKQASYLTGASIPVDGADSRFPS